MRRYYNEQSLQTCAFYMFFFSFFPKAHGSMQTHAMFYDSGKTFMSEVKRGKAQKNPRGDSPKEAMKCNRTSRVQGGD